MRHLPIYLLMLTLSALDLAGTGAFYFSLHEIKHAYALSELQVNCLVFPPAIITIVLITQNVRLADQLGRKSALNLALGIYAIGCLVGIFGRSFELLLLARCLMAAGAAAFTTLSRSLTFELDDDHSKMQGVKYYASGLAIGMALGPYIASNIFSVDIFKGAFTVLGTASLACGILNNITPARQSGPFGNPKNQYQSIRSVATMLSPVVGLLTLLTIAPAVDEIPNAITVTLIIAAAWVLFTYFLYSSQSKPDMMSIGELSRKSRPYRTGIIIFSLCFLILGFNSYYIFNILKESEHLPWPRLGVLYSTGFLSSLAAWLVMFHALPKWQTSTPFWTTGIGLFIVYLIIITFVAQGHWAVDMLIWAIALLGIASMFILASTSMMTFRDLQGDRHQFGHAFQIKNVLGQLFTLIGVVASQLVFWH